MGFPTPDDNLRNYQLSSTLDKVKYLDRKQFLVMFGTADGRSLSPTLTSTDGDRNYSSSMEQSSLTK